MGVTDRPGWRRDRHALDTIDVVRSEVRVVDDQRFRRFSSDTYGCRQRHVDTRRADVGQLVYCQRGLMGNHARSVGSPDLWPEHGFHVVGEPGDGEPGEAVDAARHPLEVPLLRELHQTDLVQPRRAGLRGGEVAGLVFSNRVEDGVPLAPVHARSSMAII